MSHDDDIITRLINQTAARWATRLREWPSTTPKVLAELEADGSPEARALRDALAARA
jgi:hypothetical protein